MKMLRLSILFSTLAGAALAATNDVFTIDVRLTNIVTSVRMESASFAPTSGGKLRGTVMPSSTDATGKVTRRLPSECTQAEIADACQTNGVAFVKFRAVLLTLTERALSK